jgi:hypothetical protein
MARWAKAKYILAASLTVVAVLRLAINVSADATPPADLETSTAPQMASQFFALLNAEREQNGVAVLARDTRLDEVAARWSAHMAATFAITGTARDPAALADCDLSSLCHRPDLAVQLGSVFPDWLVVGENVGVGGTVTAINEAFNASPSHQSNITGGYNVVGVGVVQSAGRVWVTVDFVDSPADGFLPNTVGSVHVPSGGIVSGLTAVGDYQSVPVSPQRVIDTRSSIGGTRLRAGVERQFALTTAPSYAVALQGNVTVADPAGAGFLILYPCDRGRPLASTVSWGARLMPVASAFVAPLAPGRLLCAYSNMDTDLVLDVVGWGVPAGVNAEGALGLTPVTQLRLLDSRDTTGLGEQFTVTVPSPDGGLLHAGQNAVLNVTVTQATTAGFVTAWPCAEYMPLASNLNYRAEETRANLLASPVAPDGSVCIFASSPVQMIVDLVGAQTADGHAMTGSVPLRVLDTRPAASLGPWVGELAGGQQIDVDLAVLAPRGGIATVTAVSAGALGFVTVWPCTEPRPASSTLNLSPRANEAVSNLVIFKGGSDGRVCLYSSSPAHLLMDINAETSP